MEADARARAVAALTALFIPHVRHERAGPAGGLDSGARSRPHLIPSLRNQRRKL